MELNFKHETLYLAVAVLDLYLSKAKVKKDKLQLVGAVAFGLASKVHVSRSISSMDYGFRM